MSNLIIYGWVVMLVIFVLLLGRIEKIEDDIRCLKARKENE